MWTAAGKPVPVDRFAPFEPVEVLYEFDGPRIFTMRDADGELCLAYWSDEDDTASRYVVVPTTTTIVDRLKQGSLSVHEALDQPRCWLCDRNHQGELVACRRVEFEELPADALPTSGTRLLPSLEPQPVELVGRVRELDKDRLSFELREIAGPIPWQRFVFDEELLDDVFQALQENSWVRVAGQAFPNEQLVHAQTLSTVTHTPIGTATSAPL
jgi:hypothetical protein